MSSKSLISAEKMIKDYLIDFSSLRSEDCCKYWIYPSALVCNDQSSKLFNNKKECENYYTLLFLSLNTKNYKMTKIDSESLQYIIPLELKTDTLPQERPFYIGEGTEYDEFYQIWIQQIKDIGKVDIIKQRLLEKYSEFDGGTQ